MYARVLRELAAAPVLAEVVDHPGWDSPGWDTPLRLLGGMNYLALVEGVDPWSDPVAFLDERRVFLREFVAEQAVQTNEVRRSWPLLPVFLLLAREWGGALELLELGPSAGLNLIWDRYRYYYEAGSWGPRDAALELSGEELAAVPAELLAQQVAVVGRRGVDLAPVDAVSEHGALLLESFVWADQPARLERLRTAIELLRRDPPELIQGDYVELLPELLAARSGEAYTVVFETASTVYLSRERYERLLGALADAGAKAPLGLVSTRQTAEAADGRHGWQLDLTTWPDGQRRTVAIGGPHGEWLEWRG
jgi:hypothetical protein